MNIVLCGEFPFTKFMNYTCFDMRFHSKLCEGWAHQFGEPRCWGFLHQARMLGESIWNRDSFTSGPLYGNLRSCGVIVCETSSVTGLEHFIQVQLLTIPHANMPLWHSRVDPQIRHQMYSAPWKNPDVSTHHCPRINWDEMVSNATSCASNYAATQWATKQFPAEKAGGSAHQNQIDWIGLT